MKPCLVVVLPKDQYKRYEGRKQTHFVQSDRSLTMMEVQLFRIMPNAICPPEEPGAA